MSGPPPGRATSATAGSATSWTQPVAWAGLDKVSPTLAQPTERLELLRERLEQESERTEGELAQAIPLLRSAELTARAWNGPGGKQAHSALDTGLRQRVADLRRRQADLRNGLTMLDRTEGATPRAAGPHDHLRTRAVPLTAVEAGAKRQRLLRLWSAASASLLLGAAGVILLWGQGPIVVPLLVLAAVMIVVEAAVRGRLLALAVNVVVTTVVVVAVVGLLWLAAANLRFAVGAVLLAAALYILWQTLAEGLGLRSRGRATG